MYTHYTILVVHLINPYKRKINVCVTVDFLYFVCIGLLHKMANNSFCYGSPRQRSICRKIVVCTGI